MTIEKILDMKQDFINVLKAENIDKSNVRFRFILKSPWQKRRYKDEYITPEIWLLCKNTHSCLIDYESFYSSNLEVYKEMIDEIKLNVRLNDKKW